MSRLNLDFGRQVYILINILFLSYLLLYLILLFSELELALQVLQYLF